MLAGGRGARSHATLLVRQSLLDVLKVLQDGPDSPNQTRILSENQNLRTIHAGCRSRRRESFSLLNAPTDGRLDG